MQTAKVLLAFSLASLIFLAPSCTKEDEPTYTVEYKLQGDSYYVRSMKYRDAAGNMILTDDLTAISTGVKITVAKPFTAQMEVYIDNNSIRSVPYKLIILIDGVEKSSVDLLAPLFDVSSKALEVTL